MSCKIIRLHFPLKNTINNNNLQKKEKKTHENK